MFFWTRKSLLSKIALSQLRGSRYWKIMKLYNLSEKYFGVALWNIVIERAVASANMVDASPKIERDLSI